MAILTPDQIRTEQGLIICEKIIPWGARWDRDNLKTGNWAGDLYKADRLLNGGRGNPLWITIHNTADIQEASGTDDAEQYTRATWPNQNMNEIRVHYYIDESSCWQNLREDEVGWHAGDGNYGDGNDTSLAIEIIMNGRGDWEDIQAEERGALLTAILMQRHGLDIDHVVPHRRWNGKHCPAYILPHWDAFLERVYQLYREISGQQPTEEEFPVPPAEQPLYRIQAGAYSQESLAKACAGRLEEAGYSPLICIDNGWFKVRTEALSSRTEAMKRARELRQEGFDTYLVLQSSPPKETADGAPDSAPQLTAGDLVKVARGARTYTGGGLAGFVYDTVYTVQQVKGDRVVIGINGIVTAAIQKSNLILQSKADLQRQGE